MKLAAKTWRVGLALLGVLVVAGCGAADKALPFPEATLTAPPGYGFILEDAAGHRQLSPTIKPVATPEGLLATEETKAIILGPITLPPEARMLRVESDGSVTVRKSDEATYRLVGQVQLGHWRGGAISDVGTAQMLTGKPGSEGFPEITPAMYVLTRQGAIIRLVLVEYGGGE